MEIGKKELTRRTIMRAARGVYEEKGVENTNFRDVAEAAGVSAVRCSTILQAATNF